MDIGQERWKKLTLAKRALHFAVIANSYSASSRQSHQRRSRGSTMKACSKKTVFNLVQNRGKEIILLRRSSFRRFLGSCLPIGGWTYHTGTPVLYPDFTAPSKCAWSE